MDVQSFINGVAQKIFNLNQSIFEIHLGGIRGNFDEPAYWVHCIFPENADKITLLCHEESDLKSLQQILSKSYPNIPIKNWSIEYSEEIWATQMFPISAGSPIGHINLIQRSGLGTFGGYVGHQEGIWGISNNHVIADNNNPTRENDILNINQQLIGNLSSFQSLVMPPIFNQMDVALFKPEPSRMPPPHQNWHLYVASDVRTGDRVVKVGARTGQTEGIITSVYAAEKVNYGHPLGILQFNNCLVIQGVNGSPFSLPGDSGSLVYRKSDQKLVGIVFAGGNSNRGTLSFANKSDVFLPHFGLTHYTHFLF